MIATAMVWSVVSLLIAGGVLVHLYSGASERFFDERIDVYVTTVIGALASLDYEENGEQEAQGTSNGATSNGAANSAATADAGADADTVPSSLELTGEPRFRLPFSGWYWTVRDAESGRILYASASLLGDDGLTLPEISSSSGVWRGYATGPGGEKVRVS